MNKKAQIHIAWNRIKKIVILSRPNTPIRKKYRFAQSYCALLKIQEPSFKKKDDFVYQEYNREDSPIFKHKTLPVIHKRVKNKRTKKEKQDSRQKYLDYLKTTQWANLKKQLIKTRGSFCEKCLKEFSVLDGHHLTYERLYNELPEDIQLLCRSCHRNVHNRVF